MNMYKEVAKDFEEIVTKLIKTNHINRLLHKDIKPTLSHLHWLREFCTISINMGRAMGKTRYIRLHANSNDVIISRNLRCCYLNGVHFTVNSIKYDVIKGIYPENIWIDDAHLTNDEKTLIYRTFYRDDINQTFIFLGE